MTVPPVITPLLQWSDANGHPYAGGTIECYTVGTSTLKTVWIDPGQAAVATNPVVLDAAGRSLMFGDGDYRLVLRDSVGNLIADFVATTLVSAAMYPVVSAPTIADAVHLLGLDDTVTAADLASAISAEQTARNAAIGVEANTRASGDTFLQGEVDALKARVTALEGAGGGLPLVQWSQNEISDSSGHKTVTFTTAYSSAPGVVITVAGGGYGAECIVVNSTTTGFQCWFAFPSTGSPTPVGPIQFQWIATGPA